MKFYAVAVGRSTGVFTTWEKCKEQVDGFPGNKHESFKTQADAEAFIDRYKRAKEQVGYLKQEQEERLKQEQVESLSDRFGNLTTTDENTSVNQDGSNP